MNQYEAGYNQGKLDSQEAIEKFGKEWQAPSWRNFVDVVNLAKPSEEVQKHFEEE